MTMAKERKANGKVVREKMVPATFLVDTALLALIDDRARSQDLNRGQYLRKLARRDLGFTNEAA